MPHKSTLSIWHRTMELRTKCRRDGKLQKALGDWLLNPLTISTIYSGVTVDHKILQIIQGNNVCQRYQVKQQTQGKNYYTNIGHDTHMDINIIPVDNNETNDYYCVNLRIIRAVEIISLKAQKKNAIQPRKTKCYKKPHL
jgi:hypothetical protein